MGQVAITLSYTEVKKNRQTGGTGLYMNFSIIFTEINFYSETSILLQIIMNKSYGNLDKNHNLTDRVGSLPILNLKHE